MFCLVVGKNYVIHRDAMAKRRAEFKNIDIRICIKHIDTADVPFGIRQRRSEPVGLFFGRVDQCGLTDPACRKRQETDARDPGYDQQLRAPHQLLNSETLYRYCSLY